VCARPSCRVILGMWEAWPVTRKRCEKTQERIFGVLLQLFRAFCSQSETTTKETCPAGM
jgi:hypothetical protein